MTQKHTHLEVKDWRKFQHYKEDRPAWIKLYGSLLDDARFLALPDAAQLQLVKLWLLASRMGHPLPNDARLLAGKIGCRGRFYLPLLIERGFILEADYENPREILDESQPIKTENREQRSETERTVVGGEVVGIVIGQPADYAVAITIAANNAIRARWGEQTRVLVHGMSYELTRDLQEAGIPLDVARASIVDQVERSSKATPPSTINWFRPGILASHAEQQQRALMGTQPAPTIQKRLTKTEQALRAIEGL